MVKVVTKTPARVVDAVLSIEQQNWDDPEHLAISQLSMHRLFPTLAIEAGAPIQPFSYASDPLDIDVAMFNDPLRTGKTLPGEQLLNRRLYNDALLVMHRGEVIHESYRNGMTAEDRHVIHSCTKSLCAMLIETAVHNGDMQLRETIDYYVTELQSLAAWQGITLQQVLDMQAGIEYSEDYSDPQAHYWSYSRAAGYYPPLEGEQAIGAKAWILANLQHRSHTPGTVFSYNSCLTNVLGLALEKVYGRGLAELFETMLYRKVGAEADGYFNTDSEGFPIVEGQFNLTLRDFARCAYPMVNQGRTLTGEQLFPEAFIASVVTPDTSAQQAYQALEVDTQFPTAQYKHQFWVLDPEQRQFSMLGIHGQFAWFDLNRELMIVGQGSYPQQDGALMMGTLKELWHGLAKLVDMRGLSG